MLVFILTFSRNVEGGEGREVRRCLHPFSAAVFRLRLVDWRVTLGKLN